MGGRERLRNGVVVDGVCLGRVEVVVLERGIVYSWRRKGRAMSSGEIDAARLTEQRGCRGRVRYERGGRFVW